jgi:hypothetical protein
MLMLGTSSFVHITSKTLYYYTRSETVLVMLEHCIPCTASHRAHDMLRVRESMVVGAFVLLDGQTQVS